jgi:hypothetical protein
MDVWYLLEKNVDNTSEYQGSQGKTWSDITDELQSNFVFFANFVARLQRINTLCLQFIMYAVILGFLWNNANVITLVWLIKTIHAWKIAWYKQ